VALVVLSLAVLAAQGMVACAALLVLLAQVVRLEDCLQGNWMPVVAGALVAAPVAGCWWVQASRHLQGNHYGLAEVAEARR